MTSSCDISFEVAQLRAKNEQLCAELEKLKQELRIKEESLCAEKQKIVKLRQQIEKKDEILRKFLSKEQIDCLTSNCANVKWTDESILVGLKLRFALGKHGYCYLNSNGYPCPSYSTLNRRIQHFQINIGLFDNVLELLKEKVSVLSRNERDCQIVVDEMEISGTASFDKHSSLLVGNVTLGDEEARGFI